MHEKQECHCPMYEIALNFAGHTAWEQSYDVYASNPCSFDCINIIRFLPMHARMSLSYV